MTKTLPEVFTIQDDFAPASYEQWRALAEETLRGAPFERRLVKKSYDGIDVKPIYGRREELEEPDPLGLPGLYPFVRGSSPLGAAASGCDLRQEFKHPSLATTNREIQHDLQGGVTSIQLRLDLAACGGMDPDHAAAAELAGNNGIMAYCVGDLGQALDGVALDTVPVALDAGAAFLPAAAMLAGLWQRNGVSLGQAKGTFNADPLAALARNGRLPLSEKQCLALMADLAKWTAENCPQITAVGVDTSPYHDAGASSAQDIAISAATAVEYLRAMSAAGVEIDSAARQIMFRFNLGTRHFQAVAKLRAARQVWSRVVQASGGGHPAQRMQLQASIGDRVLTRRDAHVNLLRNTVAVFAAGIGGADVVTSVPFTALAGLPDELGRRAARNTLQVLQDESHLNRVIDPAGGSWYLDQLTEQLASKAWGIFQEIERQGGVLTALQNGWIAEQLDATYKKRAADIAVRKQGLTGVSEFANVAEESIKPTAPDITALSKAAAQRVERARSQCEQLDDIPAVDNPTAAAIQAASQGATIGQVAKALGFETKRGSAEKASTSVMSLRNLAEPFERLRDACDAWQSSKGNRPRVLLANLGPVAHHSARATWSKNFFEAGGFEVLGNNGFENEEAAAAALTESGARVAVICSSDKLYPDIVPPAAAKLKAAGARQVVLAGNPGDNEAAWREAGVDQFIFVKCNVLETLRSVLNEIGVLPAGE